MKHRKMTRFSIVLIVVVCISMSACLVFAEDEAVNGGTIRGEVIEVTVEQQPD